MVRTRPHTEEASREAAARAILQGRAAAEPALLTGSRPGTADTALLADLAAGLPLVLSARDGKAATTRGMPETTAAASMASLHLGSPWAVQAELASEPRHSAVMPAAEPLSPSLLPSSSPPPPPQPPPPSSPSSAQLMAAHQAEEELATVRRHNKVAEMRQSEARRKQARLERHEAQRGDQARRQCEARQAVAAALEARRQAERGEQEARRRRAAEEVRLRSRRRQGGQSEPGGGGEEVVPAAAAAAASPSEDAAGGAPHASRAARAATDADAGDAPSPLEAYGGAVAPELPPELPRARTAPAGLRRAAAQKSHAASLGGGGGGGGFQAISCTLGGGFVVRAPHATSHGLLRLTSQNLTPASRAASASVRGRGHGGGGGGDGGGGMARPPPPQSPPPQRLDPRVRHAALCHAKIRAALAAADEPPGWNEHIVHSKTPAFTREWAKHLKELKP